MMVSCSLILPAKSDMMCVAPLREEWLAQVEQHTHVQVDCAAVETMTAAAAQLVVALANMLSGGGGSVALIHVPPALRDDLHLLGLTRYLQEPPHHA